MLSHYKGKREKETHFRLPSFHNAVSHKDYITRDDEKAVYGKAVLIVKI